MRKSFNIFAAVTVTALALSLASQPVEAATFTWTGATNGAWGTGGNWSSTPTFSTANDLLINNNVNMSQTIGGNRFVGGLTYGASAGASTLAGVGGQFLRSSSIVNNSSNVQTIANTVSVSGTDAGSNFTIDTGAAGMLIAKLSSSGTATKTGSGVLDLSASTNTSGKLNVSSGTVNMNGAAMSGAASVASGAVLSSNAGGYTVGNLTVSSGATLNIGTPASKADGNSVNTTLSGIMNLYNPASNDVDQSAIFASDLTLGGTMTLGFGAAYDASLEAPGGGNWAFWGGTISGDFPSVQFTPGSWYAGLNFTKIDADTWQSQNLGGGEFMNVYTSGPNVGVLQVVPEPTQMVFVAGVAAALGMWRMRKLRRNSRGSDATAC
jgi:hypothetical protein